MSLITIIVALLFAWIVRRRTGQLMWGIVAFAAAFLVFPMISDQLEKLFNPGKTVVAAGTQSTSCNCN